MFRLDVCKIRRPDMCLKDVMEGECFEHEGNVYRVMQFSQRDRSAEAYCFTTNTVQDIKYDTTVIRLDVGCEVSDLPHSDHEEQKQ